MEEQGDEKRRKTRIYNTCVRPILIYENETEADVKDIQNTMETLSAIVFKRQNHKFKN